MVILLVLYSGRGEQTYTTETIKREIPPPVDYSQNMPGGNIFIGTVDSTDNGGEDFLINLSSYAVVATATTTFTARIKSNTKISLDSGTTTFFGPGDSLLSFDKNKIEKGDFIFLRSFDPIKTGAQVVAEEIIVRKAVKK